MTRDIANEETEVWREYRREQQRRAEARREQGIAEIEELRSAGFVVEMLTEYQWRVDGKLDLFPTNHKYHHLPTNTRGRYIGALVIARKLLRTKPRIAMSAASCELYASSPMVCPLCGVTVPAWTPHKCERQA